MRPIVFGVAILSLGLAASSTSSAQVVTTITEEFTAAGDLEVGPDGNVYVADFGFSLNGGANGTNVYRVTPSGEVTVFATGLAGASGNAFDAEGNLYQSSIAGSRISKITPNGTVTTLTTGPGIQAPVGVAVDADGNVYNTNCSSNTISKTTPQGATTTFASNSLFSCPNGLTIDPDGNLYTSNFSNCSVMKITPVGEVTRVACASTFGAINVGNGHITYANERLYVAGWRAGVIFEMPLDGSPVSVLAGAGGSGRDDGAAEVARFHQPNGIDATPSGDTLYVNDTVNLSSNGILLHPNVVRMITGVNGTTTASTDERPEATSLTLEGAYPNPATDFLNVEYVLEAQEGILLEMTDMLGRRVGIIDQGIRPPGRHRVGVQVSHLAPGPYLVLLTAGDRSLHNVLMVTR
jgi:sugar lactone lactonase YvrE